jgi:hypothetical protein
MKVQKAARQQAAALARRMSSFIPIHAVYCAAEWLKVGMQATHCRLLFSVWPRSVHVHTSTHIC